MNKAVFLGAFLLAVPAYAQTVKDYVEIDGANPNYLQGIGVVIGLNGNGDSPKGESAARLRNLLQHFSSAERVVETLSAKNAAVVMVTTELPAFAKAGNKIDVRVSAVGDAKSILGGMLMATDLRSVAGTDDKVIYAFASGRIVGQGSVRTGNPTSGSVPAGAIVYKTLRYEFVKAVVYRDVFGRVREGKALRLNLRRPNLSVANQLALKINEQAVAGEKSEGPLRVARAVDGGSLEVILPSKEEYESVRGKGSYPSPGYSHDPVAWVDRILNLNVTLLSENRAIVVINDTTKAVSWSGVVKVLPGRVILPKANTFLHIPQPTTLDELWKEARPALSGQDLIDAIRVLHKAGLINARVVSQ